MHSISHLRSCRVRGYIPYCCSPFHLSDLYLDAALYRRHGLCLPCKQTALFRCHEWRRLDALQVFDYLAPYMCPCKGNGKGFIQTIGSPSEKWDRDEGVDRQKPATVSRNNWANSVAVLSNMAIIHPVADGSDIWLLCVSQNDFDLDIHGFTFLLCPSYITCTVHWFQVLIL